MLVSATQQRESDTHTHMPPPFETPPPPAAPSQPSRSSESPRLSFCVIQQLPASYLFYTWHTSVAILAIHLTLSLTPLCPWVHSLHLCLCSCPANRFISTIFLDYIYMLQHMILGQVTFAFSILLTNKVAWRHMCEAEGFVRNWTWCQSLTFLF